MELLMCFDAPLSDVHYRSPVHSKSTSIRDTLQLPASLYIKIHRPLLIISIPVLYDTPCSISLDISCSKCVCPSSTA